MQRIFSFCCSGSQHTEKKAIEQVVMYGNGSGLELRKVIFIGSQSPCIPCAQDIVTFVKSRGVSMNLYFTVLQQQINPSRNGISLLASYGIPMQIVDNYIWSYLTSLLAISDGKPRTNFSDGSMVDKIYQKAWDEVWSQQLGAVLHQDLPNILNHQSLFDIFNQAKKIMISKEQTILQSSFYYCSIQFIIL
ncbi:uncharacterized protein [Hetaerina americana]|uniref:uncharacterized protein n=1 Tax=Hetaerina americana TaxID=62018 RepID=UPI003A7F2C37